MASSQEFTAVRAQSAAFIEANGTSTNATAETPGDGIFLVPSSAVPNRTSVTGNVIYAADDDGKMSWGSLPDASIGADNEVQLSDGAGGLKSSAKFSFDDTSSSLTLDNTITSPAPTMVLVGRAASGVDVAGNIEISGGITPNALAGGDVIISGGNTDGADPLAVGGTAKLESGKYTETGDPSVISATGATATASAGIVLEAGDVGTDVDVSSGMVSVRGGDSASSTNKGGSVTISSGINSEGTLKCGDVTLHLGISPGGTALVDSKVGSFMVRSEYGIVDMPSIVHDTDQPTVGSAVKVSAITPAGGGLPPIYKTIFVEPSFVSRFSNTAFNVSDASPLILVDTEFSSSGALSTSYSAGSFTVVPGRSYQLSFSVNYTDNGTVVAYRRLTWLDYTASNITAYIQQNAYPQARVIVAGFAGAHGSFNSSNTQCYTATSGVTKLALRAWSDTAAGWTGMGIDRGSTITINEL